MDDLLCPKVHVPQLDLPVLDINFEPVAGEIDQFKIHPENCCYGTHVGITNAAGERVQEYRKCGWEAAISDMPLHERTDTNEATGEEILHRLRACPDEYNRPGEVVWMDFVKVARTVPADTGNVEDEDDEYGANDGIKFQSEWLPVEGTVPEFFSHLLRSIEEYHAHIYEVKLSYRNGKCEERAFIIDPARNGDGCPEEFMKRGPRSWMERALIVLFSTEKATG